MKALTEVLGSDVFRLFAIISLGKLVEQVRIRGFTLGIASIFLIAAAFGARGMVLPQDFQLFGLALFVYCVGIEAGPQFFSSFRGNGRVWGTVVLVHLVVLALCAIGCWVLLRRWISPGTAIGLFTGSLTCTPCMASVLDAVHDTAMSAAFGVIYPVSLIGNVYLVPALPRLFGDDVEALKQKHQEALMARYPERVARAFRVTNANIIGKPILALQGLVPQGVVFTRYIREGETHLARDTVVVEPDTTLVAVGAEQDLKALEVLVGRDAGQTPAEPRTDSLQVRRLIVSRSSSVGKTLSELDLEHRYHVRLTRIVRSGVEVAPQPSELLLLGDKITAMGSVRDIDELAKEVGDDVDEMFRTQFAPISIGVVLGFLAGQIPLPFVNRSLGMTGGILVIAMFLGWRVRFAGILWQVPRETNNFLKQLSLYVFFAVLGSTTGAEWATISGVSTGSVLLAAAFLFAFVPVALVYWLATRLLRRDPLETIGILAGNLNSSSTLAAINESLGTSIPNAPFALAYPLALILGIVASQSLAVLAP